MIPERTILLGLTGVGLGALVTAFALWRFSIDAYRDRMDDRTEMVFTYVTPLFMFLTAGPVYDVVILSAGGPFPTLGAPSLVVGVAGSAVTLGYVVLDVRSAEDPTAAPTDGADTAA